MSIIKCKMCGGDLNFEPDQTVCECEYCGSKQTVPTADNEKKLTMFSRASRLLRNCDFDKAAGVYESIVSEFPEEAEAYWGLVLARYGIEYVDDPATYKKIPTCHRSSFDSVLDDGNFELVMEYADSVARSVYRSEAKQIEELRKGIIAVSASEQPYDIFISYKEKDENGERTLDSVLAQDIYDALTDKGCRVFFSRISLEDKLGIEYEPYIFAALNSAKIMLVVGTDYEYFNAVWVKNEWSRFLKLMALDKSKHLIPCFKGIDAYDMPKEFNKLTAQDLGKVGAVQDLLRGIDKLLGTGQKTESVKTETTIIQQVAAGGPNVAALLKRGDMALEDKQWDSAKKFFDQVLNMNAESAEAYLGLFLADICCVNKESAKSLSVDGEKDVFQNSNFRRALQYGDSARKSELNGWKEARQKRLQREAEAAKAAEEAAAKAAEEAEQAKQARKKAIKEEIRTLKQQLKDGTYGMDMNPADKREMERLNQAAAAAEKEAEQAEAALKNAPERARKESLEQQIKEKQQYLSTLGFFKGAEKKQAQAAIEALQRELSKASSVLTQYNNTAASKTSAAAAAKQAVEAYREKKQSSAMNEGRKKLESLLNEIMPAVGSTIEFGKYPQSAGEADQTPIEWIVLNRGDESALLISKQGLACKPYNEEYTAVTWESCTLRTWLNRDFLQAAFTAEEQKQIQETQVTADQNPEYNTSPGKSTTDKIFLLSIPEAEKYFASDAARACQATAAAEKQGALVAGNGHSWWWVRSPGRDSRYAAYVDDDGSLYYIGNDVNGSRNVIRPALWVKY